MRLPILCLGDVCPDIILPYGETKIQLADPSRAGETLRGAEVQPGGSVGNTAAGIARLGTPVIFAGTAGDDVFGRMLRDDLRKEGVDITLLRLDPELPTVLVLVVVDEHGERTTYAWPRTGASHHQLHPHHLPPDLPQQIGWLHTSGMTLREEPAASTTLDLMARCKEAGIPVSLDINSRLESMGDRTFMQNLHRALDFCTLIFGSGPDELMPLTGAPTPQAAAMRLVRPERNIVCRMGSEGATVYTWTGRHHQPALPVTVSDTIGAGDAYNSGYLAAAWRGLPPDEAGRWGCTAAGACVSVAGARGCPTLPRLMDMLVRQKIESKK